MLCLAKQRAKKKGVPFSITEKDIRIGKRCPVLGIPFKRGKNKRPTDNSPTLDRIDPKRGYAPGNIVVISSLANRIKTTANVNQIQRVYQWLRKITRKRGISYKRYRSN
jgi:hypothetical protein